MLAWMVYVVVVTGLLGLAALAAERSAQLRGARTRWLWGAAIIASLAIPTVIASVSVQIPRLSMVIDRAAPQPVITLRQMTSSALQPSAWLTAATGKVPASPGLDRLLTGAWTAASALIFLAILVHGVMLHRRKRAWARRMLAGEPIYLSEDVGPAVVGLLRPRIVIPRWIAEESAETQALVMAHEQAHLEAGDPQLLAIAILLIVTMPWNLPLWWQLRRLRFAVEVDCDARVLRRGHDVARYGQTLLMVGERQSNTFAVVAAMTESKSFLEQRIRKMLWKKNKYALVSAAALALAGFALAAGAAEVAPPNAASANGARQEVAVDPKVLDGLVGDYRMGGANILSVTRNGAQLSAQLTGQPAVPIFASSATEFFYKVVDAQLSFTTDAKGQGVSVTLHQNGAVIAMRRIDPAAAAQLKATLSERVKAQTAQPGSEAALRRLVSGVMAGNPDYSALSPELAKAVRDQQPRITPYLSGLGPAQSFKFLGVMASGADAYDVVHANGITKWTIALDDKGTVVLAAVQPGP